MKSLVARCAENFGPAVADHVKRASHVSSAVEFELRAGARRRIRWRRMGERSGNRDGGGCGEMKAVGMWARKVGRRSERTGGLMKLTILAVIFVGECKVD